MQACGNKDQFQAMAAIDRFEHLLRAVTQYLSDIRDGLALLGVLYTARKTLRVSKTLLEALNMHIFCKLSRNCNLSKQFGPWAVVTGGSEGIGFAYARELARAGVNLVLISRSTEKLEKASSLIEEEFHVETCCIPVDFSVGREAYSHIWEGIKDKEISILVNNVGVMYEFPQLFLDVPVDRMSELKVAAIRERVNSFSAKRLWQIVNINVATATMADIYYVQTTTCDLQMTHMILPQMVERGRGAIVVVSSGACSQITPMMTVYAGTKSFLDYFARALRYEYKDKGIVIQSLRPFYVNTKMTRYSQTLTRHSTLVPSAEVYARHAVATLGHSGRTTGYWPHTLQMWFADYIPEWIWMWGAMRLNSALQRQAVTRLEKRDKMKSSDSLNSLAEELKPSES